MPTSERQIEFRVGLFALVAAALVVGFVLVLARVHIGERPRALCVDFASISALQVRAPVRLGGIEVGQVDRIALIPPGAAHAAPLPALGRHALPQVRVHVRLDATAEPYLGADATFARATAGLIGESYLELLPSAAAATATGSLSADVPVRGVDAPRLHAMALQVESVLGAASSLLGAPAAGPGEAGQSLGALLGHINAIVGGRGDRIAAAIDDAAATLAALRVGVDDGRPLRSLIGDAAHGVQQIDARLPGLLARGERALDGLESLTGKADASLDAAQLRQILAQTEAATRSLQQVAADAQAVLHGLRAGEGTAGAFLQDSQIFDDVKELFANLRHHPWKFLWRD